MQIKPRLEGPNRFVLRPLALLSMNTTSNCETLLRLLHTDIRKDRNHCQIMQYGYSVATTSLVNNNSWPYSTWKRMAGQASERHVQSTLIRVSKRTNLYATSYDSMCQYVAASRFTGRLLRCFVCGADHWRTYAQTVPDVIIEPCWVTMTLFRATTRSDNLRSLTIESCCVICITDMKNN